MIVVIERILDLEWVELGYWFFICYMREFILVIKFFEFVFFVLGC